MDIDQSGWRSMSHADGKTFLSKRTCRHVSLVITLLCINGFATAEGGATGPNNGKQMTGVPRMKLVANKITEFSDEGVVNGLDFSPDDKSLASANGALNVNVWQWQDGSRIRSLIGPQGANTILVNKPIKFSPNGRYLAACHSLSQQSGAVTVWDTVTWKIAHDIVDAEGGGSCNAISFASDDNALLRVLNRVSWRPGDTIIQYNTDNWSINWGIRTIPFQPSTVAVSPDGKFMAIGGQLSDDSPAKTIDEAFGRKSLPEIWIFERSNKKMTLRIVGMWANHIDWSADGKDIAIIGSAVIGPDAVRIVNAETGEIKAHGIFDLHGAVLRYTSNGKYFIEAGAKSVRIWDGARINMLQEIRNDGPVGALAVSKNGHFFATGSGKTISIWQLD
jgi:WD40 repeat protein